MFAEQLKDRKWDIGVGCFYHPMGKYYAVTGASPAQ